MRKLTKEIRMNAQIITIGDEILIGQVIDTNSAWMGQQLNFQGIHIEKITTVSDTHEAITHSIKQALVESDLVFVSDWL